jgi:hypothetical protein
MGNVVVPIQALSHFVDIHSALVSLAISILAFITSGFLSYRTIFYVKSDLRLVPIPNYAESDIDTKTYYFMFVLINTGTRDVVLVDTELLPIDQGSGGFVSFKAEFPQKFTGLPIVVRPERIVSCRLSLPHMLSHKTIAGTYWALNVIYLGLRTRAVDYKGRIFTRTFSIGKVWTPGVEYDNVESAYLDLNVSYDLLKSGDVPAPEYLARASKQTNNQSFDN